MPSFLVIVLTQRVGGKIKKAISNTTSKKTNSSTNKAISLDPSRGQAGRLPASYYVLMVTRRDVFWIAAGAPLIGVAAASKEFWDVRDPEQWTKEEINQLLNQSPWAKPASISFNNSGGTIAPRYGRIGPYSGTNTTTMPRSGSPGDTGKTASNPLAFQAVIRWETARPIRLAEKNRAFDDSQYYVIAAIGDFPSTGDANEDLDAREQRREMLQEFTRLDRKGDAPIYLDRIEPIATGIRFYFSRLEPIKESNKEITFTTKVGPLEFKAKFALKEMLYRGKLEL